MPFLRTRRVASARRGADRAPANRRFWRKAEIVRAWSKFQMAGMGLPEQRVRQDGSPVRLLPEALGSHSGGQVGRL